MSLLNFMNDTVDKSKKLSEILFGNDASSGSSYSSMAMPPPMQAPDSAQMLKSAIAQAGIDNEAVNYLKPAPPMPYIQMPQFSYGEPLPQGPTDREKRIQERIDAIERGEILQPR